MDNDDSIIIVRQNNIVRHCRQYEFTYYSQETDTSKLDLWAGQGRSHNKFALWKISTQLHIATLGKTGP